jgi:PAS domain S-box-containing protein
MPQFPNPSMVGVGVLYSLSGVMATQEKALKDATLMAIAEINESGGVLGCQIEAIVEDGESEPARFAQKTRSLIEHDQVTTLFGGCTSASRKALLPVVEELNGLLWYPGRYEGLECSPNIFYTGACVNQLVDPALDWLLHHKGDRLYLLGTEDVFSHVAQRGLNAQLTRMGGTAIASVSVTSTCQDFTAVIAQIQQTSPHAVVSTLDRRSQNAFFRQFREAGIAAETIPIMSVSQIDGDWHDVGDAAIGHYICSSYVPHLETEASQRFVNAFQQHYGTHSSASGAVEAAYTQVFLWKQAVELAQSFAGDRVGQAAIGQTIHAPSGIVQIQPNRHVSRHCSIGQMLPNGQMNPVWTSDRPIPPLPWLGVETPQATASTGLTDAAIDLLADVSHWMHQAQQAEQRSQALEATLAQLQHDVKERQQTATLLQETEALFRFLSEFAPMPLVITRVSDGQVVYANQQLASTFGASLAELIQRQTPDFYYDPADQLRLMEALEQQGALHNYEVQFKRVDDGTPFWVAVSVQPLVLNGAQVFLTALYNISDRKQIEEDLKELNAKYSALVEQIPAIVYVAEFGADGTWYYVSPRLESLLGFSPAEWMEDRTLWYQQLHPDDRERVMQDEAYSIANHQPFRSEYRLYSRDRQIRWFQDEALLLPQEPGKPLMMQGMILDISDRKTAEFALQESLEQLAAANQEIGSLNARLKQENLRMAAELDVTRRLQQMLLPKEDELLQIEDLEIAGFMEPADEIGGDYYDVIAHNGTVKIGIGDVSGHGLESGVLMLMVQTAVRTLLTANETSAPRFLSTLNQTIYNNLQRMNSDKNLTLTLLDYQAGTLYLAGQHEEIIIVRTDGTIERIDTIDLGFPIGLEADITNFIGETQLQVQPGDVVVLYTDGITEAENIARVQYGLNRLCRMVQTHRWRSAREIQDAVIADVLAHIGQQRVYDDITLLVLKKK